VGNRKEVANRKIQSDFAETAVLPAHLMPSRIDALADAAAEAQGRYQEYVRSLDDVPVLVDVVREPARVAVKDFRSGQRRDERKSQRDDAGVLREQHDRDLDQQFAEYAAICAGQVPAEPASARKTRKSGAQKKRAKRTKRSARSKH
jgi:hypothetical protein